MDEEKAEQPVFMKFKSGENITLRDNVFIGDGRVIEADTIKNLDASGNISLPAALDPESSAPPKYFGLPRWVWALVGTVVASVIAGGILHWFGWV